MAFSVCFMPQARRDLVQLYDFIAPKAGDRVARDFVARLYQYCLSLDTFPYRGTLRNDLRPNMRILGYRHQASIAFTIQDDTVTILRIFGRGQNVETELEG